ncbi:MAG: MBL fold metallo-hydrolase [Planctomycetes bacterium]|nr:MBL fold metallo-hydrolase [Planctomycetota bacterium]
MVLLGTGTSVGVPIIGCPCPVCHSDDPRNNRTRCGVIVGLPEGNLLIDTPPDLRFQLLRERVDVVHATLFTHEHADHLYGLDDLRLFPFYLGHSVPLYCEPAVEKRIRRVFDYAFDPNPRATHAGATPQVEFRSIGLEPFDVLGARVTPIRLQHGSFDVLGFRFGRVAYCTDTNGIPAESWPLLEGLDVLVLDALRTRPHATHFSLDEALEVVNRVKPGRAYFTHISHELEHAATNARLPAHVELAYDGLRIPLSGDIAAGPSTTATQIAR